MSRVYLLLIIALVGALTLRTVCNVAAKLESDISKIDQRIDTP